jgi:digeranylgeranylglycerophospholipid reductase
MQVDVAVVGAGPSGSSVAKFAAERGMKVLILERKQEVGFPSPCAGYVPKLVSRYFRIDKRYIQQETREMRTYLPSGNSQLARMQGWIVERSLFDKSLAVQATMAGARLSVGSQVVDLIKEGGEVKGVRYKENEDIQEVEAKVVVGADGVQSRVAKWGDLESPAREDVAICPQYEMVNVDLEDPAIAETYFGVDYAPGGYVWVYPTSESSAKVGLGVKISLAKISPQEYLERFIERHPIASEKFTNACTIGRLVGLIPIGGLIEKMTADGLLLVGDAAGMADPISGAGIVSGILAGKIAAKVIGDAIAEGDTSAERLSDYEARFRKLVGSRFERSLKKRRMLDQAYSSDESLEKVIPKTWITFKEFWR